MSTEIERQEFLFEGNQVRVVVDEQDEPWFVAADVARILNYRDANNMTRLLDADEKGSQVVSTPGGNQTMVTISEGALYKAILQRQSGYIDDPYQSDFVKRFQRWVSHDVLSSIRRHGAYATTATVEAMLADPDTMIRTLQALKEEREAREALQDKIDADAPKVLLAEAVMVSADCVTVARLSNLLKANGDDIGEKRLFERMRGEGFLCKEQGRDWNRPTQRALDLGVLVPRETTWFDRESKPHLSVTPYVTGKGQQYFVNRYCGKREVAA